MIGNLFRNETQCRTLAPGESLFSAGDNGEEMYVVREGAVELRINGTVVETVEEGGILGEMALIEPDKPRSADAVARDQSSVACVDKRRFTFLVQETPFFALAVMRIMAERLRHMNAQLTGQ